MDRIYASWNSVVPKSSEKTVYEAWWRIIGPLDIEDCQAAVDELVLRDSYMPRPGGVAVKTVLYRYTQEGGACPPSPEEAWTLLVQTGEAAARGELSQVHLHECLRATIQSLGGTTALRLHTNGDRNSFTEVYNRIVESWQLELVKKTLNGIMPTK